MGLYSDASSGTDQIVGKRLRPRVLVVEDSEVFRYILRTLFEQAGFDYFDARDGVEGVEVFDRTRPDIVFTDYNMPRMNGLGLISAIRRNAAGRSVPIFVLSSEPAKAPRGDILDAGANGWIDKPFEPAALVNISRCLIKSQSRVNRRPKQRGLNIPPLQTRD
ncbi:response regulator [Sagittula sp. SSi028]|uniref:response regulator n=1 Tax=Sagittula sp. SSi028 TaxID=3400636 RepID=UPI003AF6A438